MELKEKPSIAPESVLKISTVNVASIRAAWTKGFLEWVEASKPDIICVQETKLHKESEPSHSAFFLPGYNGYFLDCDSKKGYSGTAIYSKIKPISVKKSFEDSQGRCITIEFSKFYLVNTYVPNAGMKLENLKSKVETWNPKVKEHLDELRKTKPAFWTGDLNVAHQEIDIFEAKGHEKTAGFTKEEREWFDNFLKSGYVDIFRNLYPDRKEFTFFSYRGNAKARGRGWRLDYFCVHKDDMKEGLVVDCSIEQGDFSDHIPLSLYLNRNILTEEDKTVTEPIVLRINDNTEYKEDEKTEFATAKKGKKAKKAK